MWVKVDDGFVEHPKVMAAARHLGANGAGRVVAVWLEAICYTARNLTDGLVPTLIARKFITDRRPLDVLDVMAMPDVRLMTKTDTGYRFHDFGHYQPSAAAVKEKRQRDRERKSVKDSSWNRNGSRQDSARIPERSRARDPVPVPSLTSFGKVQGAARRDARVPVSQVRRHLLAAAYRAHDAHGPGVEMAEDVKSAAAHLRADYHGREIGKICDAVEGHRQRDRRAS